MLLVSDVGTRKLFRGRRFIQFWTVESDVSVVHPDGNSLWMPGQKM